MKTLLLSMFMIAGIAHGQTVNKISSAPLTSQAGLYLDAGTPLYNPVKGFQLYKKAAEAGNPQAMNAIAILYSKGIGTEVSQQEAFLWFKKATEKGYVNAWYNLGSMYRKGLGTPLDFTKAYQSFSKGAAASAPASLYARGYMLYKGLGCTQSYEEAVKMFRLAIKRRSISSMYLLGLCYANGYGLKADTAKAKYWLKRSALAGYQYSKDELKVEGPENKNISPVQKGTKNAKNTVSFSYKTVAHNVKANNLNGVYKGYILKYDWSGKFIIDKVPLKLVLSNNNQQVDGLWTEQGKSAIPLTASVTDSAIVFSNTSFASTDHYSPDKKVQFEFKSANLQLINDADSIYITGNISLWATDRNEPEKPMSISLHKDAKLGVDEVKSRDEFNLLVYPNPFDNTLQFSFYLQKKNDVMISLIDLSGRVIYQEQKPFNQGANTHAISSDSPPGAYILKLSSGGRTRQVIVLKH
ncbi:MAG: SEL1-like repeat protein [Pyrinomonadaceae bacterium]|nr:SEL1-like repeat protein [Sphingobacteriaceae bacterium]